MDAIFEGFPDRFYVIKDHKIEWKGGQGPVFYSVPPLMNVLKRLNS